MANRRYTVNEQLKLRADYGSRPAPGVGGVQVSKPKGDSSIPYTGAPGPKGAGYKPARIGFHEVKTRVKQDLADDIYGNAPGFIAGPIGKGAPVPLPVTPENPPLPGNAEIGLPPFPLQNPLNAAIEGTPGRESLLAGQVRPREIPIGRRGRFGRRGVNY